MARVTNPWHPHLQQLWIAAAVRLVAVGAVFHHRRVLPQEWPAAFGMAADAVLIDRALQKLARIRAAVRIVATGAGDFALAIRHVRGALQLGPPHLVALQAQFRLRHFRADVLGQRRSIARVCRSQSLITFGRATVVDVVAVHAGHSSRLVGTAAPEHLIALGVAGETGRIALFNRSGGILGEADGNRVLAAAGLHVGPAGSVTGFAAQLLLGSFGVGHGIAHDGVDETLLLVGVAGHAHLGADVIALGRGRRSSGGRRRSGHWLGILLRRTS